MNVENITESDILELLEMCKLAHKESRYSQWPFCDIMVKDMITNSFLPGSFGKKYKFGEAIAGFFIGSITTMEFSPQPIGMQTLFWVRPKYRNSRAFYTLAKAFLGWCDSKEAVPFINPHFAENNSKTYKMLEKLGLNDFGRIYSRIK